jgi:hypothetical protein
VQVLAGTADHQQQGGTAFNQQVGQYSRLSCLQCSTSTRSVPHFSLTVLLVLLQTACIRHCKVGPAQLTTLQSAYCSIRALHFALAAPPARLQIFATVTSTQPPCADTVSLSHPCLDNVLASDAWPQCVCFWVALRLRLPQVGFVKLERYALYFQVTHCLCHSHHTCCTSSATAAGWLCGAGEVCPVQP